MKNNLGDWYNSFPQLKQPLYYIQLWERIWSKAKINPTYDNLVSTVYGYIDERHGFNMLLPDEYKNLELCLPWNAIILTLKEKYSDKFLQSFDGYLKDRLQGDKDSDKKFADTIKDIRKYPELLEVLELMQKGMSIINNAKNIDDAHIWVHILYTACGNIDDLTVASQIWLN